MIFSFEASKWCLTKFTDRLFCLVKQAATIRNRDLTTLFLTSLCTLLRMTFSLYNDAIINPGIRIGIREMAARWSNKSRFLMYSKKLNKTDAITVENPEKLRSNGTSEEPDNSERQGSFSPRTLPRRCLSVEEATTNDHRTNLASGLRPPSVYLEMEHMRRSQSSKSRRTRSNYPVGERII